MSSKNSVIHQRIIAKTRNWLHRANAFIQQFDRDAFAPCAGRIDFLENRIKQLESIRIPISIDQTAPPTSTTANSGARS